MCRRLLKELIAHRLHLGPEFVLTQRAQSHCQELQRVAGERPREGGVVYAGRRIFQAQIYAGIGEGKVPLTPDLSAIAGATLKLRGGHWDTAGFIASISSRSNSAAPVRPGSFFAGSIRPDWTHRVRVARETPMIDAASDDPINSSGFGMHKYLQEGNSLCNAQQSNKPGVGLHIAVVGG